MFETNPIESLVYLGFYHVPICDWVVISPEGRVIDTLTGTELRIALPNGDGQYPRVDIPSFRSVSLHRLLGYTFLKYNGDPELLQINHIDGDKLNYALSNLEWVSVSENVLHAYQTGLRSDNRPVRVKHLITNKEQSFYSLQSAARFFECNGHAIHKYLNNRDDYYPFQSFWNMIYEGEDWRALTIADVGKIRKGRPKPVVIVTNVVTIYESAQHCANELDVSVALVASWISGRRSSVNRGIEAYYLHEYQNSLDDAIYLEEDKSHYKERSAPKRKPVAIRVTDIVNGEIVNWVSTEAFANSLGVKKNTIQKAVLVNNGRWKQFNIEYMTNQ